MQNQNQINKKSLYYRNIIKRQTNCAHFSNKDLGIYLNYSFSQYSSTGPDVVQFSFVLFCFHRFLSLSLSTEHFFHVWLQDSRIITRDEGPTISVILTNIPFLLLSITKYEQSTVTVKMVMVPGE